jgi:hypothetical protein
VLQTRLQIQVEVEVDLRRRRSDAGFVEQGHQPLVLLGREDDGGAVGAGGKPCEGPRLTDQRLTFEPAEVERLARTLSGGDGQASPGAEVVRPVDGRQLELPRKLTASCLRRREHGGLVQQGPRVDALARGLEVEHHGVCGKVVEE